MLYDLLTESKTSTETRKVTLNTCKYADGIQSRRCQSRILDSFCWQLETYLIVFFISLTSFYFVYLLDLTCPTYSNFTGLDEGCGRRARLFGLQTGTGS